MQAYSHHNLSPVDIGGGGDQASEYVETPPDSPAKRPKDAPSDHADRAESDRNDNSGEHGSSYYSDATSSPPPPEMDGTQHSLQEFVVLLTQRLQQQLHEFEIWAHQGFWAEFHRQEYIPFVFPSTLPSASTGEQWQVPPAAIPLLRQSRTFHDSFLRALELVCLAWGWMINDRAPVHILEPGQGWPGNAGRLHAAGNACLLLDKEQAFASLIVFARFLEQQGLSMRLNHGQGRTIHVLQSWEHQMEQLARDGFNGQQQRQQQQEHHSLPVDPLVAALIQQVVSRHFAGTDTGPRIQQVAGLLAASGVSTYALFEMVWDRQSDPTIPVWMRGELWWALRDMGVVSLRLLAERLLQNTNSDQHGEGGKTQTPHPTQPVQPGQQQYQSRPPMPAQSSGRQSQEYVHPLRNHHPFGDPSTFAAPPPHTTHSPYRNASPPKYRRGEGAGPPPPPPSVAATPQMADTATTLFIRDSCSPGVAVLEGGGAVICDGEGPVQSTTLGYAGYRYAAVANAKFTSGRWSWTVTMAGPQMSSTGNADILVGVASLAVGDNGLPFVPEHSWAMSSVTARVMHDEKPQDPHTAGITCVKPGDMMKCDLDFEGEFLTFTVNGVQQSLVKVPTDVVLTPIILFKGKPELKVTLNCAIPAEAAFTACPVMQTEYRQISQFPQLQTTARCLLQAAAELQWQQTLLVLARTKITDQNAQQQVLGVKLQAAGNERFDLEQRVQEYRERLRVACALHSEIGDLECVDGNNTDGVDVIPAGKVCTVRLRLRNEKGQVADRPVDKNTVAVIARRRCDTTGLDDPTRLIDCPESVDTVSITPLQGLQVGDDGECWSLTFTSAGEFEVAAYLCDADGRNAARISGGASVEILAGEPSALHSEIVNDSDVVVAGTPLSFELRARDKYGNACDVASTWFRACLRIPSFPNGSIDGGNGDEITLELLPIGPGTFRPHADTCVSRYAGSASLEISLPVSAEMLDTNSAGVVGHVGLTVLPAVTCPRKSHFVNVPSECQAGQALSLEIAAFDEFGNPVHGDDNASFVVSATARDGTATHLDVTYKAIRGLYVATGTLNAVGPYAIQCHLQGLDMGATGTGTGNVAIHGSPFALQVTPGAASPSQCIVRQDYDDLVVAGAPISITVQAVDSFGNHATSGGEAMIGFVSSQSNHSSWTRHLMLNAGADTHRLSKFPTEVIAQGTPFVDNDDGTYSLSTSLTVVGDGVVDVILQSREQRASTTSTEADGDQLWTHVFASDLCIRPAGTASASISFPDNAMRTGEDLHVLITTLDAYGNAVGCGGDSVFLHAVPPADVVASGGDAFTEVQFESDGTIPAVVGDLGDGTYEATVVLCKAGTYDFVVMAMLDSTDAETSWVECASGSVEVFASDTIGVACRAVVPPLPSYSAGESIQIVVQARDRFGNPVASGGDRVVVLVRSWARVRGNGQVVIPLKLQQWMEWFPANMEAMLWNLDGSVYSECLAATDNNDGTYSVDLTLEAADTYRVDILVIPATVGEDLCVIGSWATRVDAAAIDVSQSTVSVDSVVRAGGAMSISVDVKDRFGNKKNVKAVRVSAILTAPQSVGGAASAIGLSSDAAGVFHGKFEVTASGDWTVLATIGGVDCPNIITATVDPAPMDRLMCLESNITCTVGSTTDIPIQAMDQYGNHCSVPPGALHVVVQREQEDTTQTGGVGENTVDEAMEDGNTASPVLAAVLALAPASIDADSLPAVFKETELHVVRKPDGGDSIVFDAHPSMPPGMYSTVCYGLDTALVKVKVKVVPAKVDAGQTTVTIPPPASCVAGEPFWVRVCPRDAFGNPTVVADNFRFRIVILDEDDGEHCADLRADPKVPWDRLPLHYETKVRLCRAGVREIGLVLVDDTHAAQDVMRHADVACDISPIGSFVTTVAPGLPVAENTQCYIKTMENDSDGLPCGRVAYPTELHIVLADEFHNPVPSTALAAAGTRPEDGVTLSDVTVSFVEGATGMPVSSRIDVVPLPPAAMSLGDLDSCVGSRSVHHLDRAMTVTQLQPTLVGRIMPRHRGVSRALVSVHGTEVLGSPFEFTVLRSRDPETWTSGDVCEWLAEHGLDGCVPAFARRGIDGPALATMAMDELSSMVPSAETRRDFVIQRQRVVNLNSVAGGVLFCDRYALVESLSQSSGYGSKVMLASDVRNGVAPNIVVVKMEGTVATSLLSSSASAVPSSSGSNTTSGTAKPDISSLRRIRTLMSLRHPSICKITDVGLQEDGRRWFTMHHLKGQSLQKLLGASSVRGGLAPEMVREIAVQLLSALSALHACNIVHGGIDPTHVICQGDDDGRRIYKLIGFRFAEPAVSDVTGGTHTATRKTGFGPSASYVAPERLSRPASHLDIWALGVLLYQCMSCRVPFHGHDDVESERPAEPLLSGDPQHSKDKDVIAMIMRALEKRRGLGFASTDEMLHMLEAALLTRGWLRRRIDVDPFAAHIVLSQWSSASSGGLNHGDTGCSTCASLVYSPELCEDLALEQRLTVSMQVNSHLGSAGGAVALFLASAYSGRTSRVACPWLYAARYGLGSGPAIGILGRPHDVVAAEQRLRVGLSSVARALAIDGVIADVEIIGHPTNWMAVLGALSIEHGVRIDLVPKRHDSPLCCFLQLRGIRTSVQNVLENLRGDAVDRTSASPATATVAACRDVVATVTSCQGRRSRDAEASQQLWSAVSLARRKSDARAMQSILLLLPRSIPAVYASLWIRGTKVWTARQRTGGHSLETNTLTAPNSLRNHIDSIVSAWSDYYGHGVQVSRVELVRSISCLARLQEWLDANDGADDDDCRSSPVDHRDEMKLQASELCQRLSTHSMYSGDDIDSHDHCSHSDTACWQGAAPVVNKAAASLVWRAATPTTVDDLCAGVTVTSTSQPSNYEVSAANNTSSQSDITVVVSPTAGIALSHAANSQYSVTQERVIVLGWCVYRSPKVIDASAEGDILGTASTVDGSARLLHLHGGRMMGLDHDTYAIVERGAPALLGLRSETQFLPLLRVFTSATDAAL